MSVNRKVTVPVGRSSRTRRDHPPVGSARPVAVLDGPVRAKGTGTFEPVGEGQRTRFTFELDFEGHGVGKLLVPLVVRRQARKEVPETHAKLKRRLEGGSA